MMFIGTSISGNLEYEKVIDIELNISEKGLPTFEIFGLISKSIEESKKRILKSFESCGINFPLKNININLSPAEIPKEGTHLDFAIACCLLRYTNNFQFNERECLFIGELSFEGKVKPVGNILFFISIAKEKGFKKVFVSNESLENLFVIEGIEVFGVNLLTDVLDSNKFKSLKNIPTHIKDYEKNSSFISITGNRNNKRKIAICLAGKHHLLIKGFPGSGKSLISKSSVELLPNLEFKDALEVAKLHSYSGIDRVSEEFFRPPVRLPHNTSSYSSIFGSAGKRLNPGELSLSNNGILILDELPEFNRQVLEGLRIPLENKEITISRSASKKTLKTDFILIGTMNPCRCGYFNHPKIDCKCTPQELKRYNSRISGPILDRIDVTLNFDVETNIYINKGHDNYSFKDFLILRNKVNRVRQFKKEVAGGKSLISRDEKKSNLVEQYNISDKSIFLLKTMQENYSVSNRRLVKILKLSETIALFEEKDVIELPHIQEALSLNRLEL